MSKSIAPNAPLDLLPKHFDSKTAETRWSEYWEQKEVYNFDFDKPRSSNFCIDTPPPTVSGSLHIGHVFSYVQTDIIARFQRMSGKNVFYPMGWDDNGLPTERRVQSLYHVRCDPALPYDPNLELEIPSAKEKKDRARTISRKNFIELCQRVTLEDEKAFMSLFRRIGLSVDWRLEYATINDHCRRIAQYSFLDLFEKSEVYQVEAPCLWDVDFQTAVAQAELEDRELEGAFHHIQFGVRDSKDQFVIATTRPELLPSCIGVTAHPDDSRYKGLIGKEAISPLFSCPVPIFASDRVDPEKGTGILMVCSFGDQTDVHWWKEQKLVSRQLIGKTGRFEGAAFGEEPFPSLDAETAQNHYDQIAGKNVKQARQKIVELLSQEGTAPVGKGPALTKAPQKINHSVKFYEKGERPLEFISTRQWFVSLLKHKSKMLAQADQINWHPDYMKARYRSWTENLNLDWCISRQRYFGVPIPVWYKLDAQAKPLFEQAILPALDQLPIDPMTDCPPSYSESQRDQPNGFTGEMDVFDTWFTSSMSPQISSHWPLDSKRHERIFPMDLRPQGHEIIRTWAFYTIAKALLHEEKVPWKNIALSGWIVDPHRKKMSKSKGNTITPSSLLDDYGADAIRYWAANARLGADTAYDEKVFKVGRRLVTKLYNASRFVLSQKSIESDHWESLDLSFLCRLKDLVSKTRVELESFNYAQALSEIEKFFWNSFTDTYLELVKLRAKKGDKAASSCVRTLRLSLKILLRLFSVYLPFICEEIWSWEFNKENGRRSIHQMPWPSLANDFKDIPMPSSDSQFELALKLFSAINKHKTGLSLSLMAELDEFELKLSESERAIFQFVLPDLQAATKVKEFKVVPA
ncbi:MAG: valine--tRNA ligase [Bradymonadales bacterium]|nr:MAG: valine--tRNA ligase [Bradymonadales bacterium]